MSKRPLCYLSFLILCGCLMSGTWAQQGEEGRPMNLREILIHRALSMQPKSAAGTNIQGARAEVILAQPIAVYELGTYPGGTWVAMNGLNNDGVAVGAGDVKVGGESRPIGVPIFGPKGYVWFDLGQFSSKQTDIGGSCNRISAAGMIVGYAATEPGYQHAFSWTPGPGLKKRTWAPGNKMASTPMTPAAEHTASTSKGPSS